MYIVLLHRVLEESSAHHCMCKCMCQCIMRVCIYAAGVTVVSRGLRALQAIDKWPLLLTSHGYEVHSQTRAYMDFMWNIF